MRTRIMKPSLLVVFVMAATTQAGELVPFKGTFSGQTQSAVPTGDPDVVFVTTGGGGQATQLGHYSVISPHFTNLVTLEVWGTQEFTAANGDTLTAEISGQFVPTPDGLLAAQLTGTITGGTGRFEGATGSYTFDILFDFVTFISVATIDGTMTSPGRSQAP
ncbi:MAG TPA: hypothetical protein VHK01_05935 [Lacipirellulaceae bacterium]|nr:hypothetical protein [Lacipirellulaceae bacterium]